MKESAERKIELGFLRNPKAVFNEVESVYAKMIRSGWVLNNSIIEDNLKYIHLIFDRELDREKTLMIE